MSDNPGFEAIVNRFRAVTASALAAIQRAPEDRKQQLTAMLQVQEDYADAALSAICDRIAKLAITAYAAREFPPEKRR